MGLLHYTPKVSFFFHFEVKFLKSVVHVHSSSLSIAGIHSYFYYCKTRTYWDIKISFFLLSVSETRALQFIFYNYFEFYKSRVHFHSSIISIVHVFTNIAKKSHERNDSIL